VSKYPLRGQVNSPGVEPDPSPPYTHLFLQQKIKIKIHICAFFVTSCCKLIIFEDVRARTKTTSFRRVPKTPDGSLAQCDIFGERGYLLISPLIRVGDCSLTMRSSELPCFPVPPSLPLYHPFRVFSPSIRRIGTFWSERGLQRARRLQLDTG